MEKKKRSHRGIVPTSDADSAKRDSGVPGGGAGRRDVVEPIPDDIHVDPYITEGNPGYEESGNSEIRPVAPPASGAAEAAGRTQSQK